MAFHALERANRASKSTIQNEPRCVSSLKAIFDVIDHQTLCTDTTFFGSAFRHDDQRGDAHSRG
jgi:hypothetical protein